MKRLITILLTLLLLVGVNYFITVFFPVKFVDYAFVVGMLVSFIIWFFTSKGGVSSTIADSSIAQQTTNFKMEKQAYSFSPNLAFFTALAYTLLSFIMMFIYYRDYFLK